VLLLSFFLKKKYNILFLNSWSGIFGGELLRLEDRNEPTPQMTNLQDQTMGANPRWVMFICSW